MFLLTAPTVPANQPCSSFSDPYSCCLRLSPSLPLLRCRLPILSALLLAMSCTGDSANLSSLVFHVGIIELLHEVSDHCAAKTSFEVVMCVLRDRTCAKHECHEMCKVYHLAGEKSSSRNCRQQVSVASVRAKASCNASAPPSIVCPRKPLTHHKCHSQGFGHSLKLDLQWGSRRMCSCFVSLGR